MSYRALAGLWARLLIVALPLLAAASCSGGADRHAPVEDTSALPVPAGVDAKLWSQLSAELEKVLAEEGTARRTSAAPIGPGSRVADLAFYGEGAASIWSWSHRNQGDYDLNGIVTIADLTPIGIHFGKRFGDSDWISAQYADGDNNGLITIADVTPIGQNFGGRVDGYELQSQLGFDGEFTLQDDVPMTAGVAAGGGVPRFQVSRVELFLLGTHWRVVPYVVAGTERIYGPPSNLVGGGDVASAWPTRGRSNNRLGLSNFVGPTANTVAWRTELEGSSTFSGCVLDNEGTIYIGTSVSTGGLLDEPASGHIYAIEKDGSMRWKYSLDTGFGQQPTLSNRGTVYFADYRGSIYSMTPDGKMIWRSDTPARYFAGWLQSDNQGSCYSVGLDPGLTNVRLYRLNADGSMAWNREIPGTYAGPFEDVFGRISVIGGNADLTFYLENGTQDQQIPVDGSIAEFSFALALEENIAFCTSGTINQLQIFPLGSPPLSFDLGTHEHTGALGANAFGQILITTRENTLGENAASTLRVINDDATEDWSMPIGASTFGQIVSDSAGDMYFSGLNPELAAASGVYSVGADQSLRWIFETEQSICLQPVIPANGQLLLNLSRIGEATTEIVMLDSN